MPYTREDGNPVVQASYSGSFDYGPSGVPNYGPILSQLGVDINGYAINKGYLDSRLSAISGTGRIFIQPTAPTGIVGPYIWVQTNINGAPNDFSIWVETGL